VSLRDQILSIDDIQIKMVEVPEWGVTVEVRGMNGADRQKILDAATAEDTPMTAGGMFIDVILATSYDPETGERLFTEDDKGPLLTKNSKALDRLATAGYSLSGMAVDSVDEAGKQFPDESES
jgi:hypothetical protein